MSIFSVLEMKLLFMIGAKLQFAFQRGNEKACIPNQPSRTRFSVKLKEGRDHDCPYIFVMPCTPWFPKSTHSLIVYYLPLHCLFTKQSIFSEKCSGTQRTTTLLMNYAYATKIYRTATMYTQYILITPQVLWMCQEVLFLPGFYFITKRIYTPIYFPQWLQKWNSLLLRLSHLTVTTYVNVS